MGHPAGRRGEAEGLGGRGQVEGDEAVEAECDDAVRHRTIVAGIFCTLAILPLVRRPGGRQDLRMKTAILIFDRLTALDAVGPYEVLRSVPGWEVCFVAAEKGEKRTDVGSLGLSADYSLDEVTSPDIVLVPGGLLARDRTDGDLWLPPRRGPGRTRRR